MFNKKYLVVFIVLLVALMTVSVAADVTNTNTKAKVTKDTSKVTNTQKIVKTTENTKKIKTNNKDNITSKKTKSKQTEVKKNTISKKVKKDSESLDLYVSDTTGSDSNTGTNDKPFKTLQKAIDKTTNELVYNIHIKEGTYKGVGNTNLTVNGNNTINFIGDNPNNTIFDGEAKYDIDTTEYHWESSDIWSFYVNHAGNYFMTINEGSGLISMSNFTIKNMYAPGGSSISGYPHATIDNFANLNIDDMKFIKNHGGVGSAIRNNNGGTLTVNNSFFEDNRKSSSTGNDGIIYNNGTTTIINSIFNHNYARWGTILNDKNMTITNTTLSNNIAYDGKSLYKYGAGIAYNTGGSDFYLPGYFLTYTDINNCTFINNDQTDIYGFAGNLNAIGNKFINSTGIWINDTIPEKTHNIIIENNVFDNIIDSTLLVSLYSSEKIKFAINANVSDSLLIIRNNEINSKNGTMITANKATISNNKINIENEGTSILVGNNAIVENNSVNKKILVNGTNNSIKFNKLASNEDYAVYVLNNMINNNITDNKLHTNTREGDEAVSVISSPNIVENNQAYTNLLYCSPDVSNPQQGNMDNPTTIDDAISRIDDEGTIILLKGSTGEYLLTNTITINSNNLKTDIKTLTIKGDNITLNGQNTVQILNIQKTINVTIENITFQNGHTTTNGGALYSEANLTLKNVNFYENVAEGKKDGGAIYLNNGITSIYGTNNYINNYAGRYGGVFYINNGIVQINGTNTFINNSAKTSGGIIYSKKNVTILGNNTFTNSSSSRTGGLIYSTGSLILINAKINQSTGSTIIYVSIGNNKIINNNFINCNATSETLEIKGINNIIENNTYTNCTIKTTFNITLDDTTIIPIQMNDIVTINITRTPTNPDYYDEDIMNKIDLSNQNFIYEIYVNNQLLSTTESNVKSFTVKPDTFGDFTVYAIDNTPYTSNTLTLDVEIDHKKNVYLVTNVSYVIYNNPAKVIVAVYDKSGNIISEEGIVYIYDNNNQLLGQNKTSNGIATVTTTNMTNLGTLEINIKYLSNQTNNQTNTSNIIVGLKDVYVSPSVIETNFGNIDTPTTINDALSKISNEGTIHLLPGTFNVNEKIEIKNNNGITKFNITSEDGTVIFNAQGNLINIFTIAPGMTIQFNNIQFINSKESAILCEGNLTINGTNIFNNNTASMGAAIYNKGQGLLIITGTNNFTNNNATNGGAIYSFGKIIITENNNFINNQVKITTSITGYGGGAIFTIANITINGTNKFINNSVSGNKMVYGGAIYVSSSSIVQDPTLIINGSNIFDNNKIIATQSANGGAISSQNTIIEGNNIFKNNIAEDQSNGGCGGAIYASNKNVTITGSNIFDNNTASTRGGTLYLVKSQVTIIGNTFKNSHATERGGFITAINNNAIIMNNTFENATSQKGGTIYYYCESYVYNLTIENNKFTNISAIDGGAVYVGIKVDTIKITNNTFTNINAENETLNLEVGTKNIQDNTYINSSINIENINITSPQENKNITEETPINLKIQGQLKNPDYYDENILTKLTYTIYSNNENKLNATGNEITFNEKYTKENKGTINIHVTLDEVESNTITVFIQKPKANIEISTPNEVTINETIPITIIIKDDEGNLLTGQNITINNENIEIPQGVIIYQYTPTTVGEETINVILQETELTNKTTKTIKLTVTVNKDEVIEQLTNTTQEQEKTINQQENTIKEEQKKVNTLNNTVETQKQNIEKLEEKVEKLTEKTKTKLTISKATATVGKKVTIKVTVKDANGNAVTGGKVSLKVNGKVLKDSNNNIIYADVSKGVASIKYLVPGSWIKQNPKIQAIYTGNDKYADSTVTKTKLVKVNKGSTTITLTPNIKSTKAGSKVIITVKHIDTNTKKGLTSKVAVKVNGKTYKVKVKNGEGVLTYTVPAGMNAKTVKVTASHSSKYYNKATSKTSFKVTKTTPTIKTTKTTYKSKKTTIKGKILDANNKVLTKNVKVTVKVDGKVVLKNKVVKKGKINLSFKKSLKKGYHELVITSKATKAFNKASFTGVLKV